MTPLEKLFALEIEQQRKQRQKALEAIDPTDLYSYYQQLRQSVGTVTTEDIERLANRFMVAADNDVINASDSVASLLGLRPIGS